MSDLFDFDFYVEEQPAAVEMEKQVEKQMIRMPKVGDSVLIPSIDHEGVIHYIDTPNLYNHHFHPIQVLLNYDYEFQSLYRTNLKDLVFLD